MLPGAPGASGPEPTARGSIYWALGHPCCPKAVQAQPPASARYRDPWVAVFWGAPKGFLAKTGLGIGEPETAPRNQTPIMGFAQVGAQLRSFLWDPQFCLSSAVAQETIETCFLLHTRLDRSLHQPCSRRLGRGLIPVSGHD